jgi:2-oxo-4-hydroxy-4-carboxy-5-ureidoimidazoline decarboxylase
MRSLTRRSFAIAAAGLAGAAAASRGTAQAVITLAELNRMSAADFASALDQVFERAPWVIEAVVARRPFATVSAMHEAMVDAFRAAPRERQRVLLASGIDRLAAGLAARTSAMSGESRNEQARAGLDTLTDDEARRFVVAASAYRARFGYPYIIAVLRHSPESIVRELDRRLANDEQTEFEVAVNEVFLISRLRLAQRVAGEGMPNVFGRLDTHVIDETSGRAAENVEIELVEFFGERTRSLARVATNKEGRLDRALIENRPVPIGRYELRFGMGAYFARRAGVSDAPRFLDVVPVRFSVGEPEARYHVPLLVTPFGYSTYKGN